MMYLVACLVAFAASALTFISGFGLGTLLLPAFAAFMPVERAVALTAVVHFLNGLFKLALVWRRIEWPVVMRFGGPALVASSLGAWWLVALTSHPPLLTYEWQGTLIEITAAKLVISMLLLVFVLVEWVPSWKRLAVPSAYMPLGGVLSGLAGGISGLQGAVRAAFLSRAGLDKERFVATGVMIACLIDVSRLVIYLPMLQRHRAAIDVPLLVGAVVAAAAGALVGRRYLERLTMDRVRQVVAVMLLVMAVAMALGLL